MSTSIIDKIERLFMVRGQAAYHGEDVSQTEHALRSAYRAERSIEAGLPCELIWPAEATRRCPAIRADGLSAALWSATETCVDPRQVVDGLPSWLADRHGVRFEFGCAVHGFDRPTVRSSGGDHWAEGWPSGRPGHSRTLRPDAGRDDGFPCRFPVTPRAGGSSLIDRGR